MIIKEIFPQCDFCNTTYPDEWKGESVEVVREQMRKAGWKRVNGKDKCPECIRFGVEVGKRGLL